MSRPKLISFLTKVRTEMNRRDGFSRYDADVSQNTFYFSPSLLREALIQEFDFREIKHLLEKGTPLHSWIKARTNKMLGDLRERYKQGLDHRSASRTMKGNQHYLEITLQTETNPRTSKPYNNFQALRRMYVKQMNEFAVDLRKEVNNLGEKLLKTKNENSSFKNGKWQKGFDASNNKRVMGGTEVDKGSDLVEGGHDKGFEVLESKIQAAMDKAFNEEYPKRVDREILNRDLKKLGIDLTVERDDRTGTYSFKMQSTVDNQKGGFLSAGERKTFEKQLKNALELLNNEESILNLQGSPSMLEVKKTEARLTLLKPFEKVQGATVEKPKKLKKEKKKPVTQKSKVKSKRIKQPTVRVAVSKVSLTKLRRKRQKGSGSSASHPLRLIGLINKDLPDTVRKNMQAPGLENQTGRFAESVKLTDVVQTPKGYPSFGYTYQKNPYQVFEMGRGQTPWASPERDPRKVIDRSIREIAAQFAIGRFYTRRE